MNDGVRALEMHRYLVLAGTGDPVQGKRVAAARLGVSASLVQKMASGRRNITPDLALAIEQHAKEIAPAMRISKAILVWGAKA